MIDAPATRWLHLRHPSGFSDDDFERFRSGCALWEAYVRTSIAEHARLGDDEGDPVYVCLPPTRSADRTVVTLPLAGRSTLGSRAEYEDWGAFLLAHFLPLRLRRHLEEGLTEDIGGGAQTFWRPAGSTVPPASE